MQMWFENNNLLPRKVIKITFVFRKKGEKKIFSCTWWESATQLLRLILNRRKAFSCWWFYSGVCFLKLPRASNPKKQVCVWISYGSLSSLWFPSVRNGKAKFLPPSHASTRRGRTRHTCSTFATRHSSSAERAASRGNRARAIISHLKSWAWPPQLFSVSEGIKLQNLEKSELQGKPAA